ncbi:hypothetical protein BH18THE1_BH18THE1_02390 [soil metagenome]
MDNLEYTANDLKALNDIVHMAHSDPEFRIEFFKNPKKTLEKYDVSHNAKILVLKFFNELKI